MKPSLPVPLRLLARAALLLYPRDFRRAYGAVFVEAAEDRWRRIAGPEGSRTGVRAHARFLAFLAKDTWIGVPVALGSARGAGRSEGSTTGGGLMGWIEALVWDGRVAARSVVRRPGLSGLVVGMLALGIGANAAIFGVLDRVVLHPFPFEHGDRMAFVVDRNVETGFSVSPTQGEFEAWRESAATLEDLAVLRVGSGTLYLADGYERVETLAVSGGLTSMIGLRPAAGRAFGAADAEPGAGRVVMLHEDFWRSVFGADPGVVGRSLTLNEKPVTVVGVWPAAARLRVESEPDILEVLPRGEEVNRAMYTLTLALLRPGVDPGAVEAELRGLSAGLDEEERGARNDYLATVLAPHSSLGPDFARGLWILFVGVGLLLLGAAANAASLLLNRAVDRAGELGVRLALGGSGPRLVRTFLLEGALLVGAGAVLGLMLAHEGGAALAAIAPEGMPRDVLAGVGGRVPFYALGLVGATALVCGIVPAVHLRSPRVRRLLTGRGDGSRDRGLLRSALVGAQVTLAMVLLVGSALTVRSFRALYTTDPGFALDEMVTVAVQAPASRFPDEAGRAALMERVEAALAGVTGVTGIDGSGTTLLSYSLSHGEPKLVGDEREIAPDALSGSTGAEEDFFEVLGIPILEGRAFTPDEMERDGPQVVIVNDVFASRYPEGVLGRELLLRPEDEVPLRVVGVVGSVKSFGLAQSDRPVQYYLPDRWRDAAPTWMRFNLRVEGDPARVLALAVERIRGLDESLVVSEARTGLDVLRRQTAEKRFLALLLVVFGGVSLLLAVGGVYGALSLQVARRTRELGIRIALGAGRRRVVREVFARGLRPVAAGALAGAVLAGVATPYLEAVLYQVSPVDPVSFAVGLGLLLAAVCAALVVPARRATRVEPQVALRSE